MRKTFGFIFKVCVWSGLVVSTSTSFASEEGLGTYLCSLKIYETPFKINGKEYGYKLLVDIEEAVQLHQVAKDKEDWTVYQQVFEGVLTSIRKQHFIPQFYMVRLITDERFGNQKLRVELSMQRYNKFKPSKFAPILQVSHRTDDVAFLEKADKDTRITSEMSCRLSEPDKS